MNKELININPINEIAILKTKELKTFRTLLLVTVFIYPAFGFINTFLKHSETNINFIERIIFSSLIICALLLSYINERVKNSFYEVITSFTYLGTLHLAYIGYCFGYSFSHTLGMIIVLIGTSFVYKEIKHLGYYLLFNLIIVTSSIMISPENELDKVTSFIIFFAFYLVIFFALQLRVKSLNKIKGSEANMHALIENAEGIIWSIDNEFNYIAFNKSYLEFTKNFTQVIPETHKFILDNLFETTFQSKLKNAYERVLKGENLFFEHLFYFLENEKYYSFSLSPITIDYTKTIGLTVFGNDITNKKKHENELLISKELAENLVEAKERFLASMSHEIRTPLNGILGFTKVLLQNKDLSNEQKKQLGAIKSSGDILLVIINDILDLSKIEAGKLSLEEIPIDLTAITRQAIDTFEVKADEKKIKIHQKTAESIPKMVLGDSVRISQILLNILSNAIKFTPENGKITVESSAQKIDNQKIKIEIKIQDSGIGIPKDKLETIFEPFVQTSDDTARKYGGTGLGLSIVKKLVEMMEGTIHVDSKIEKGTTFCISIILSNYTDFSKEIMSPIQEDNFNFNINETKILLAEDNHINQLLATTVLEQFGYHVDCAENGKIAVEMIEKEHFDIILMDLMMPEMDGYEATLMIREMGYTIPIIALTADVTSVDIEKCYNVGMNDYVTKPFDPDNLNKKIAFLINQKIKK
jgi:signal transduction histidine kinase/ActR/RegA family two-component response regulator